MGIIVLLLPINFFPFFPSLNYHFKSKTTIFSIQREIILPPFSEKLTKASTNNFKIDINGISNPPEMCKDIIST